MSDLEQQLRALADHPPVPVPPVDGIARRALGRRRRRRFVAAGASAAVVAVIAAAALVRTSEQGLDTVGPPPGPATGAPTPATAGGAVAVVRLAELAEAQPPLTSPGRDIVYTRQVQRATGGPEASAPPADEEHWIEAWDLGNGRRRTRQDTAGTVTPWGAAPEEWRFVPAGAVAESKQPPLSRAPASLTETANSIARTESGSPERWATFRVVDGLTAANPDPQARAGWLRLLAQVPGIQVHQDATDRTGRHGLGISITLSEPTAGTTDWLLIVDANTATVLSTRQEQHPPATSVNGTPASTVDTTFDVHATDTAPPATVTFS